MQKQKWCSVSSSKNNKYTLVTGANGFVGSALCKKLFSCGKSVKGAVRFKKKLSSLQGKVVVVQTGAIDSYTSWGLILDDVDVVIHLAGMAHKTDKRAKGDLSEYRQVNVIGTERLASACAQEGVRRFIFVSSIGVNGERTDKKPFTENDISNPVSAYAVSKWEAERALFRVAEDTGMEVVILRLPLVYGPNAPGNFGKLMSLIKAGLPLPLGNINNLRSFLYIGNLVDAIMVCAQHPKAAGEIFMVSDGQDISTPDLIKMLANAMNKKPILFYLPLGVLKALCEIIGKSEELEKLAGSLVVDSSKIRNLLGWRAPFTLEEGIRETVKEDDEKSI